MKIYKTTDKVSLQIDNIQIQFSPLSYQQKQEIFLMMTDAQASNSISKMNDAIILVLKYALKSVTGLKNSDETDYSFTFEDSKLSDDSIDVLMNLPVSSKLQGIAGKLLNGVPSDFEIDGVSYVKN